MTATPKPANAGPLFWSALGYDGERLISLRVMSQPDRLRLVRSVVSEAAQVCGCSEDTVRDIVLAVDEACQNIIRHAYGGDPNKEFYLDIRRNAETMVFYLFDFAERVDINKIKPRDLDEIVPGGLGTHFINECMDSTEYPTPPAGVGNLLRMEKKIA